MKNLSEYGKQKSNRSNGVRVSLYLTSVASRNNTSTPHSYRNLGMRLAVTRSEEK